MSDLRVSVELGATLPFDMGGGFGNVKPVITISGIDPDGDVDAQIRMGIEVVQKAFVEIDGQLDISISEIISTEGHPGYRQKVENLEGQIKTLKENFARLTEALQSKGIVEAVRGKKEAAGV